MHKKIDKCLYYFKYILSILIVFLIAYYYSGATQLPSNPIHHDDYSNLSSMLSDFDGAFPRPISTLLIAALSQIGFDFYIFVLWLALSLYVFGVIVFISALVNVKLSIPLILSVSLLVSTLPDLAQYQNYTGLMTNLSSGVFGIYALISIYKALNTKTVRYWVFGISLLILSAFAKEDFVLPISVLCLLIAFKTYLGLDKNVTIKKSVIGFLVTVIILVMSLLLNKFAGSAFVSGTGDHYSISLSLIDLYSTYKFYLFGNPQLYSLFIAFVLASIIYLCFNVNRISAFFDVVIICGIVFSLVLPYSLLPNHLATYYSFMWYVWVVTFLCVVIFRFNNDNVSYIKLSCSFLFCLVLSAGWYYAFNIERSSIISWYENQSNISGNISKTLNVLKGQILKGETVGVVNPPSLSPWSHSSGQYLERVEGLQNKWIVFVEKDNMFYTILSKSGTVEIKGINEVCNFTEMKFISFDYDGHGKLIQDCESLLDTVQDHKESSF